MVYKFNDLITENVGKKYGLNVKNKTILFTDIKGSSELWKSSESEMFKNLNKLETLITKICDSNNGLILKTIGDSFMISFDKLIDAINFSIELQEEKPLKVKGKDIVNRIGFCSGQVYELETERQGQKLKDYFGNVVNTASRMESKVSDVSGFAFAYIGKIDGKDEIDALLEEKCKISVIDYKEKCSVKDDKRVRSGRLLLDSHKHLCEHLSELKGVGETTAYKCNLKK